MKSVTTVMNEILWGKTGSGKMWPFIPEFSFELCLTFVRQCIPQWSCSTFSCCSWQKLFEEIGNFQIAIELLIDFSWTSHMCVFPINIKYNETTKRPQTINISADYAKSTTIWLRGSVSHSNCSIDKEGKHALHLLDHLIWQGIIT